MCVYMCTLCIFADSLAHMNLYPYMTNKHNKDLMVKVFLRVCEEMTSRYMCLSRGTQDKKEADVSSSVCVEVGD